MNNLLSTTGRNLEGLILSDSGGVGVEKSSAWPGDPAISCTFLFFVNLWESGNPQLTRGHSSVISDIVIGGTIASRADDLNSTRRSLLIPTARSRQTRPIRGRQCLH